jgi:hypothetical protein
MLILKNRDNVETLKPTCQQQDFQCSQSQKPAGDVTKHTRGASDIVWNIMILSAAYHAGCSYKLFRHPSQGWTFQCAYSLACVQCWFAYTCHADAASKQQPLLQPLLILARVQLASSAAADKAPARHCLAPELTHALPSSQA